MSVIETHTLAQFSEKFELNQLSVHKSPSWAWSVRPGQATLGAGILSLNRHALTFSEVTSEEMADLHRMIGIVERTLKQTFDHNILNYLMLMMVDHHVHYHVIPRYDCDKSFNDMIWVDSGWPALPALGDAQHEQNPDQKRAVRDVLINNLKL
jgi:diadenosine tetraphosphate (Ap4A) HIT family hydrolase